MKRSHLASSAAVLLVAAMPAAAEAATLSLDKRCYREGATNVPLHGAGFNPNAQIKITLDGAPFTDPANPPFSDAMGNLEAAIKQIGTPKQDGRNVPQKTYVLGASDGTNTAETSFISTRLDVTVSPKRGAPGKRKRVRARGFDQGRLVRFHVRGPRKRNGKVGKAKGPCGKINKKVKIFGSTFPTGVYTVQFDQNRRYKAGAVPRVRFQVTIFQSARPALAAAAFTAGETWTPLD